MGNDTLNGGTEIDKMTGGQGNDTYFVDSAKDSVTENAKEGSNDLVVSAVSYVLGANLERLSLNSSGNINGTGNALDNHIGGLDGDNKLDGAAGNDEILGHEGEDTLIGGAGNDSLEGGEGNDLVVGDAGNDTLDGGDGNDTMKGGAGNDLYVVNGAQDQVAEAAGQGTDSIVTFVSFDLSTKGLNVENARYVDMGSAVLTGNNLNNELIGNAGADTLIGNAGNDTLEGGIGGDTMTGGIGNDVYVVFGADTITEQVGQGTDEIRSLSGINLGANIENATLLSGIGAILEGNELANVLKGNAGNDDLRGNESNDTLIGAEGNDRLNGGTGKDVMQGGKGNDTYHVDNIGDVVIENANEGLEEEVITTLTNYTLGANIEDLTFLTAANNVANGNVLDNGIEGRAGNDKFDGKAGDDTLLGLDGNDTLIGGDGDDFLSGWVGEDQLDGGNGNDLLSGLDGNDTLKGGAGDDELFGEAGDDLLIGGAGNDSYYVEDTGDKIQEAANGGIDTIRANITLTLGDNIENAKLEVGVTVTGNTLDNVIEGSVGADKILGSDGNDTLSGLLDVDTLTGGTGNDVLDGGLGADVMEGGAGNDLYLYRLDKDTDLPQLGGDTIVGFETGKDRIDVYDLFQEFNIFSSDVVGDGYLRLLVSGGSTQLQFDSNGGGDAYITLATLQNVTNALLIDIVLPAKPPGDLRRRSRRVAIHALRLLGSGAPGPSGASRERRQIPSPLKSFLMHF